MSRCSNTIWLFEKPMPLVDPDNNRIIFKGNKPPTVEEVYLNFRGQHTFMQVTTKRQSSHRDAALQTVKEVKEWWQKAGGYWLKTDNNLVDMIICHQKKWSAL